MPPGLKFDAAGNPLVFSLTQHASVLDAALLGAQTLGQIDPSNPSAFQEELQDLLDELGMMLSSIRKVVVRHGHFLAITVAGTCLTLELPL